jgi:hypothetical protein
VKVFSDSQNLKLIVSSLAAIYIREGCYVLANLLMLRCRFQVELVYFLVHGHGQRGYLCLN